MEAKETTIRNELMDLERQFWKAIQDRDIDAATRLTDFPCIISGASGIATVDRKSFESMMQSASYTLHEFSFKDVEARSVSEDVAVVAYTVTEKLTVDGQPVTFDASDSSLWVRRDGAWRCAMHSESVLGDSYGRDRIRSGQAA